MPKITSCGDIEFEKRIPAPYNRATETDLFHILGGTSIILIIEADKGMRSLSADNGKPKQKENMKELHDEKCGDRSQS